eukprot:scaffold621695_cov20-Prasinocladus_malaysianus.AAC.1
MKSDEARELVQDSCAVGAKQISRTRTNNRQRGNVLHLKDEAQNEEEKKNIKTVSLGKAMQRLAGRGGKEENDQENLPRAQS